jgi:peroxiredoxin
VAELGELRDNYQAILDRGVEVVAVSVDSPETSARLRERLGLDSRFLSDPEGSLMDAVSLRHEGGAPPPAITGKPAGNPDIFLPATFLVDGDGVIRWAYRPDTYRVRATIPEVLAAIDAAQAGAS